MPTEPAAVTAYISAAAGLLGALFGALAAITVGFYTQRGQRRQATVAVRREVYARIMADSRTVQLVMTAITPNPSKFRVALKSFQAALDASVLVSDLPVRASLNTWSSCAAKAQGINLQDPDEVTEVVLEWNDAKEDFVRVATRELGIGTDFSQSRDRSIQRAFRGAILLFILSFLDFLPGFLPQDLRMYLTFVLPGLSFLLFLGAFIDWNNWRKEPGEAPGLDFMVVGIMLCGTASFSVFLPPWDGRFNPNFGFVVFFVMTICVGINQQFDHATIPQLYSQAEERIRKYRQRAKS